MLGHIRLVLHFTAAVSGHEANTVASKTIIKNTHTPHKRTEPLRAHRFSHIAGDRCTHCTIRKWSSCSGTIYDLHRFTGRSSEQPSERSRWQRGMRTKMAYSDALVGLFFFCVHVPSLLLCCLGSSGYYSFQFWDALCCFLSFVRMFTDTTGSGAADRANIHFSNRDEQKRGYLVKVLRNMSLRTIKLNNKFSFSFTLRRFRYGQTAGDYYEQCCIHRERESTRATKCIKINVK